MPEQSRIAGDATTQSSTSLNATGPQDTHTGLTEIDPTQKHDGAFTLEPETLTWAELLPWSLLSCNVELQRRAELFDYLTAYYSGASPNNLPNGAFSVRDLTTPAASIPTADRSGDRGPLPERPTMRDSRATQSGQPTSRMSGVCRFVQPTTVTGLISVLHLRVDPTMVTTPTVSPYELPSGLADLNEELFALVQPVYIGLAAIDSYIARREELGGFVAFKQTRNVIGIDNAGAEMFFTTQAGLKVHKPVLASLVKMSFAYVGYAVAIMAWHAGLRAPQGMPDRRACEADFERTKLECWLIFDTHEDTVEVRSTEPAAVFLSTCQHTYNSMLYRIRRLELLRSVKTPRPAPSTRQRGDTEDGSSAARTSK